MPSVVWYNALIVSKYFFLRLFVTAKTARKKPLLALGDLSYEIRVLNINFEEL